MTNILPADTYVVINKTILSESDRRIITMLYQPIIGGIATNLYFTLCMDLDKNEFMSEEMSHHHLMTILGLSLDELKISREKLEAVGLLKTYFKEREEVNNYIYELFSPLSINEFFTHPVLNVVLYSVVGKKEYERVTNYFKIPKLNISDYEDITKSFSDVFNSSPSTVFENTLQNIKDINKLGININNKIDFDFLISSIPKETINEKTFNNDNRKLIEDLSYIYNLNVEEIKNIVLSSLNDRLMIDKTMLRKNARNYYLYQNNGKLPSVVYKNQPEYLRSPIGKDSNRAKMIYTFETTSPYNFLKSKNKGTKPTERDMKLIESLSIDLRLQPAVINVLIDYVLRIKDNKLVKSYVETIAGQWKRLNIETAEEAMNQAVKESKKINKTKTTYKKKEKELPEWFDQKIEKQEVTIEEENEMKDLLKDFK
ncbi:MAG: DnaD domain protein [Bacilli bacterium]|nr:DnaD domain protein [Bacilli bacterium]